MADEDQTQMSGLTCSPAERVDCVFHEEWRSCPIGSRIRPRGGSRRFVCCGEVRLDSVSDRILKESVRFLFAYDANRGQVFHGHMLNSISTVAGRSDN